jgi:hypothetical protein
MTGRAESGGTSQCWHARFLVVVILVTLICLQALGLQALAGSEKPVVAVFNIQPRGVPFSKRSQERLSDYLAARLAASGAWRIVPRDALRKRLLGQKKKSYRSCYDSTCQIELGRELAAQKSLSTQVMRIERGKCVVTSTLYDLKKAASEGGATAEGGCSLQAIKESLDSVAGKLTRIDAPEPPSGKKPSSGVVMIETKGKSSSMPVDFDPASFDALGFLPRARKLAREKMEDAVLVDFDVQGVHPDGHVDLTLNQDYRANYYFRSPARSKGNPNLPANVEQEIECLVYVEVSASQVEVYKTTSMDNCKEKPRPGWKCSLKQAWQRARKEGAPGGNIVAKVSWLWDGWYFDFGDDSLSVPDECE